MVNRSSEGEGSSGTDNLSIGSVGTSELDGVGSIGSVGGDIPVELELVIGVILLTVLVILIVEGGTVPVDMDVEVVNLSGGIHGSDQIKLDGGSLGERVRGDGGGVLIEVESRGLRIAVTPGDDTGVSELVDSSELLVEEGLASLDEVVHKVGSLGPVGEISLDGVFL